MIVINLWLPQDHKGGLGESELDLAAVVNDRLDISRDPELIEECIENDVDWEVIKHETLYEIELDRAVVMHSHPASSPAFHIRRINELQTENGHPVQPLIKL